MPETAPHVLVVDDNLEMAMTLADGLRDHGFITCSIQRLHIVVMVSLLNGQRTGAHRAKQAVDATATCETEQERQ